MVKTRRLVTGAQEIKVKTRRLLTGAQETKVKTRRILTGRLPAKSDVAVSVRLYHNFQLVRNLTWNNAFTVQLINVLNL